jgi:pimeloyl-ACP methyl ester carboxylesterase
MTDFGTPVGMKIALRHPDWVNGLIFQNGVISLDGLSPERLKAGENAPEVPTAEERAAAERFVSLKTALYLYRTGARHPNGLNPDAWTVDSAALSNDDSRRTMVDLTLDARNNRKSYPAFQQFLGSQRPRTLVLWGKNDPIFGTAAAEAIHRLVPDSTLNALLKYSVWRGWCLHSRYRP